jgi:hypothetical protein
MRRIFAIALSALLMPALLRAENLLPGNFVAKIQDDYRNAKTSEEIKSVTAYCKAKISSFSFDERDRLSVEAIKLLEADKIDEANALFRKINSLEELDTNLSMLVCKRRYAIP